MIAEEALVWNPQLQIQSPVLYYCTVGLFIVLHSIVISLVLHVHPCFYFPVRCAIKDYLLT